MPKKHRNKFLFLILALNVALLLSNILELFSVGIGMLSFTTAAVLLELITSGFDVKKPIASFQIVIVIKYILYAALASIWYFFDTTNVSMLILGGILGITIFLIWIKYGFHLGTTNT